MGSTPGGRRGGGRRRNPPSALRSSTSPARRPWRPWPAFVACLQNARPRAPCAASPGLAGRPRDTSRLSPLQRKRSSVTPPRSHGSGVIEPRFESGSVGCPRAPLPRSGRSLILTGTRDSIRLRTRVTIRPCSELRAPRPRHGPLRGVTSPRGILSWCSPGRRQHQGPLVQAGPHPSSLRWRQRGGGRIRTPAPPAGGRPSRSVSSVHAFCAWSAGRHLFAGQSYCERSLGQRCTVTASRSKGTSRFSGTTSVKSSHSSHYTNPAR